MNEQQFTQQENLKELAMYQKLCHMVMKHDKPVKGNTKDETQAINAPFGKKSN